MELIGTPGTIVSECAKGGITMTVTIRNSIGALFCIGVFLVGTGIPVATAAAAQVDCNMDQRDPVTQAKEALKESAPVGPIAAAPTEAVSDVDIVPLLAKELADIVDGERLRTAAEASWSPNKWTIPDQYWGSFFVTYKMKGIFSEEPCIVAAEARLVDAGFFSAGYIKEVQTRGEEKIVCASDFGKQSSWALIELKGSGTITLLYKRTGMTVSKDEAKLAVHEAIKIQDQRSVSKAGTP